MRHFSPGSQPFRSASGLPSFTDAAQDGVPRCRRRSFETCHGPSRDIQHACSARQAEPLKAYLRSCYALLAAKWIFIALFPCSSSVLLGLPANNLLNRSKTFDVKERDDVTSVQARSGRAPIPARVIACQLSGQLNQARTTLTRRQQPLPSPRSDRASFSPYGLRALCRTSAAWSRASARRG